MKQEYITGEVKIFCEKITAASASLKAQADRITEASRALEFGDSMRTALEVQAGQLLHLSVAMSNVRSDLHWMGLYGAGHAECALQICEALQHGSAQE